MNCLYKATTHYNTYTNAQTNDINFDMLYSPLNHQFECKKKTEPHNRELKFPIYTKYKRKYKASHRDSMIPYFNLFVCWSILNRVYRLYNVYGV